MHGPFPGNFRPLADICLCGGPRALKVPCLLSAAPTATWPMEERPPLAVSCASQSLRAPGGPQGPAEKGQSCCTPGRPLSLILLSPPHPDALCGTWSRASKTALVLVKTLQKLQGAWPWAEQGPSVPRSRAGQSRPPGPGWGLRQEAWSLCRGRTGSTTARLFCPVASWRNENNNNF